MNQDIRFLTVSEVIRIHDNELEAAGGLSGVRDLAALESAVDAPQATYDGNFLMDIFDMAATYVNSLAGNHPFLDGNKRAALASALTFLFINGYEINESSSEELADKTLDLVTRKISKSDFAQHLKERSMLIQ
jgi:death-on-curing protein